MKKGQLVQWDNERFVVIKNLGYGLIVNDSNGTRLQIPSNATMLNLNVIWNFTQNHIDSFFPSLLICSAKRRFLKLTKHERRFNVDFPFFVYCELVKDLGGLKFEVSYLDFSKEGYNNKIIPNQVIQLRL